MDTDEITPRGTGAASRPPQTEDVEDTPLFTDVTYSHVRRTLNSGRPETTGTAAVNTGRFTENTTARGGRDYSSARRSAPSGAQRPAQSGRDAPVYMELSWDDLRSGADIFNADQKPSAPPPQRLESASVPRTGNAGQYFGGFDQEMEALFYNRGSSHMDARRPGAASAQFTDIGPVQQHSAPARPQSAAPAAPAQPQRSSLRDVLHRSSGASNEADAQSVRTGSAPRAPRTPRPQTAPRTLAPPRTQAAPRNQSVPRTQDAPRTAETGAPRYMPPRQTRNASSPPRPPAGGGHARSEWSFPAGIFSGRLKPILAGGGALLLILLIVLVVRNTGSSRTGSVNVTSATSIPTVTRAPEATPVADPEATPTPSPSPSPTPSGPKAKRSGNLVVPADWGPVIPERSRAVYDSFFDRSCMIGNSLVEGFLMYSGMTNIRYIYRASITVSDAIGGLDLSPITLNEPGYYSNIYLMFGLNEIGMDVNVNIQGYKKLVDFIRQYQPDANIIIISVTPVIKRVDQDPNEVQSMERIDRLNATLREFCVDQNCWYLDIYSMLLDDEGYLSSEYAYMEDGKHFEKSGYVAWANYMKTHYVDDGLLTE